MIKFDNVALRIKYHSMNGMTHAFALKDGNKWILYFGRAAHLCGFEEGVYSTRKAALADAERHHPELKRVIL